MTAATNAAFWRGNASRRRRSNGAPKAAAPDLGTDATRARLQPAPWAAWPSELQAAAIDIDLAVRLIAGGCLVQAAGATLQAQLVMTGDWEPGGREDRLVRRYCGWRAQMRAIGWDGQAVLDAVVLGGQPPGLEPWMLRRALKLFATGRVL